MEENERKVIGNSQISLPCNNADDDEKFSWNYQPHKERFLCSRCGKEAVHFVVVE